MDLSLTLTDQILIPLKPFLTGIILSFYRVSSTLVFNVFSIWVSLKVMLQEAICNNELEGNNFGTLLKQLETMSQQCRVALKCRCKSCCVAPPLNIGDCNICWNYPSPFFFQSGVAHLFGHGSKGLFRWRVCGHIVTDVKRNLLVSFANIAVNMK